jgi:predicted PolB exonuclease-like 3'-5' exonuclease
VLVPSVRGANGFDLPVLRYRAMVHAIPAIGLASRPYFHRYSDDAIDLCDVLASYSSQAKVSLHELCKVMGLLGKPNGISGADVDGYHREGRIREIADYCESDDVVNTYRVWLRYELFRGGLSYEGFRKSEDNLMQFINMRGNTKPHLAELVVRD